ncbi:MAG: DUF1178 family protein [Deferrisomatales bacterium]|nr:DUF1178 family protein [Deferrisomatales bacterium]
MITFDLACDGGHRFEGWFGSARDFEQQMAGGLVECPLCGSRTVTKQLSPVAVHMSRRSAAGPERQPAGKPPAPGNAPPPAVPPPEAFFRVLTRFVESHFEDVGASFAQEARRIDSGESEQRNIRGSATPEEEDSLREDGVEFFKLALPKYDA